jgi:NAD(P)-dependent dehydrogenase (short-subunit alcohol dehydrogenase family)
MADQAYRLDGQVVAITGGAGGIGIATARAVIAAGGRVALGDLDEAAAVKAAEDLGPGNLGAHLDVTDPSSFEGFVDRVESEVGPLEVLINNAGVMILGPLDEEADEVTEVSVGVNLMGVLNGTKIAMRRLKPRGRGRIVNIASQAGKSGLPGGATYSATKFAVVGLCEAVRNELRGTGVGVTCVMPGPVDTQLGAGLGESPAIDLLQPPDVAEAIVKAIARGEADVWIPRRSRFMQPPVSLLPAGGRDFVMRALKVDRVLTRVDSERRAEYEKKAAEKN